MALEHTVNVGFCGSGNTGGRGVGTDVLPLRVPSCTTSRVHIYKHLVVVGMFPHVIYHFGANSGMVVLVTVQLVGKGIEQAIA